MISEEIHPMLLIFEDLILLNYYNKIKEYSDEYINSIINKCIEDAIYFIEYVEGFDGINHNHQFKHYLSGTYEIMIDFFIEFENYELCELLKKHKNNNKLL